MKEEKMPAKIAFDEYKKNKVITASGVELIVQLYDEVVRNIQIAKVIISKSDKLSFDEIKRKNKSISKSMNIIAGLADSLDMEKGGEIAINLGKLYEFVNMRLLSANVNNDPVMLDDALRVLNELREAWVGILKQENQDKQREAGEKQKRVEVESHAIAAEIGAKKAGVYNRLAVKI